MNADADAGSCRVAATHDVGDAKPQLSPRRSETEIDPSPPATLLVAFGAPWLGSSSGRRLAVRLVELAAALAWTLGTLSSSSRYATEALILLLISGLCWLLMIVTDARQNLLPGALILMSLTAGAANAIHPSAGVLVGVAAAGAASTFRFSRAITLISPALLGFLAISVEQSSSEAVLVLAAVILLGLLIGGSRRQITLQTRRAARAELVAVEQQHNAMLVGERNRLGRDLHDVLGHTLGAVSVQVTALDAQLAAGAVPMASIRQRIDSIQHLLAEGVRDARDASRALRSDGAPLDELLARLCDLHGADLQIDGQVRDLAPLVSLTVYRVAQEALTNALKHASRSSRKVEVTFGSTSVIICVDNDEVPLAPRPGPDSRPNVSTTGQLQDASTAESNGPHESRQDGLGITGMHERVKLAGGRFSAGQHGDVWRVVAELPYS